MINIVIDTSIFRTDPKREKAAFRALHKLAVNNFIKIHIPEVVSREFTTQQLSSLDQTISDGKKFISALKKKSSGNFETQISSIENILDSIFKESQEQHEKALGEWANEVNGELYAVQSHHGMLVLNSYFTGSAPFSQPKDRKDFPDAFIYEAIKDLAKEKESLHLVCNDENLRSCSAKLKGVITHSTLEEFLKSGPCTKAEKQLLHIETLNLFCENIENYQKTLTQQLNHLLLDFLPYRQFRDEHIKSEDNCGAIEMLTEPQEINFESYKIERLGADTLLIPFNCELDALIYYPIYAADYWGMEEGGINGVRAFESENSSDHYLEANEDVRLNIEGIFSLSMRINSNEKINNPETDFLEHLDTATFSIEEIKNIEIIDQ